MDLLDDGRDRGWVRLREDAVAEVEDVPPLARLVANAADLGADSVVGSRLPWTTISDGSRRRTSRIGSRQSTAVTCAGDAARRSTCWAAPLQ